MNGKGKGGEVRWKRGWRVARCSGGQYFSKEHDKRGGVVGGKRDRLSVFLIGLDRSLCTTDLSNL